MCGRFSLNQIPDFILELLGFGLPESFQERFNIAPSENSWVVLQEKDRKPVLQELYWGLIPFWAKEKSIGMRAINARAESVAEKPMFREAYQKRRCLVPASGFYEWRKNGKEKIPYYFSPINENEPLVFAGLWDDWNEKNENIRSFTIITTTANDFMKPIHNRMPLILKPEFWRKWIAPEAGLSEIDKILEQPVGNDVLQNWEVGPYVNNAAHEGSACIEPIDLFRNI
ncbi:SOS response-associated peptidase [uncultured Victivallis sp.]|uniref:SOS response-associated peptidase n=1 Tax=uncultured Victivallis sp. TaxID=354118 RepID=UPI0025958167|nr:SOS response-associated peptidase [uncultured Victivallis sp.]